MSFNPKNWYWQIGSDTSQFWSSAANAFVTSSDSAFQAWVSDNQPSHVPALPNALAAIIKDAGLLDASDTTMHRITEAVALGSTTWTTSDVIAWVNYRRALRAIASGTDTGSTQIPAKPAYPEGT